MNSRLTLGIATMIALAAGIASAAENLPDKWFIVQDAVNTQSSFMLRVDVDRPDRVYSVGETMTVTIKPEKDCYLYLLYYGAGNQVACLFPNKYQQDNLVRAGTAVAVPSPEAKFQFTCSPPCGKEVLQVVGTLKPVDILKQQQKNLTKGNATVLGTQDIKDMVVELRKGQPRDWAEARIEITTTAAVQQHDRPRTQGKRFAICVGISQFKSDRIPALRVSHRDAEQLAAALKDQGKVDDVVVLTNSQATRAAIEKAVFKDLPQKAKAGDEVFLFFSCHGGRCADTTGEDPGGMNEYLVPYDGEVGKPDTMILDKTFTRWVRELDGRKVGIILDCCYSGGMSKGVRAKGLPGPTPKPGKGHVFYSGMLQRSKNLGQGETMLMAACQENQLAWEMTSEDDGSVLTHFVLKAVKDPATDDNGDGHISVGEVYRHTKTPIEDYVRKTFSAEQNPWLLDNAHDKVWLKP